MAAIISFKERQKRAFKPRAAIPKEETGHIIRMPNVVKVEKRIKAIKASAQKNKK